MALITTLPGPTTTQALEAILTDAETAAPIWAETTAEERASALHHIADRLDDAAERLIEVAHEETHLPGARLQGELKRTTFQLRLFAEMVAEGSHTDARIDHADPDWGMGPRPDIRRRLEPMGPVLVFAGSNFPFAFSVAGGDTSSALAAGCPVILKAHSGHPRLSAMTAAIVSGALEEAGAPAGVFGIIFGTDSGRVALMDERVKASSFTGSIPGGRALLDIANARPEPIPFYGELGSVNPTFVTMKAAKARGEQIAHEFVGSYTLGAGQFCTKPGILLVPAASGIVESLADIQHPAPATLLVATSGAYDAPPAPTLMHTTAASVLAAPQALIAECFGPAALVVSYHNESELLDVARVIDGQLTATIHGEDDDEIAPELIRLLSRKAGRLLWNQWPTGVSVTYAQHHGGPYPASTSTSSTSVGTAAIFRFLRPVAYQGMPQHLLPPELRDANPLEISRRVNGVQQF